MPTDPLDPLSLDFASLHTLGTVYRSKSFTEAAETLGVNQSAVSYTIDRLRKVFHDPLFLREGGKQVATPRCQEVMNVTSKIIEEIETLARPAGFDPQVVNDHIRIACNYYERILIIPKIINRLMAEAPNLRIEIVDAQGVGHLRLLESQADILIGPFDRQEAGYYTRNLFTDHYVCLMSPSHPFAHKKEISKEDYLSFDNIVITYGGKWRSAYLNEIKNQNKDLNIALKVPSPAGIEGLVSGTELVATIPLRLAEALRGELSMHKCPFHAQFNIGLVWTGRTHSSEMFKWLRQLIANSLHVHNF